MKNCNHTSLKGRTVYEVKVRQPGVLEEALIIATIFENLSKKKESELYSTFVNSKVKPKDGKTLQCYNCGRAGHKSNVCRDPEKSAS